MKISVISFNSLIHNNSISEKEPVTVRIAGDAYLGYDLAQIGNDQLSAITFNVKYPHQTITKNIQSLLSRFCFAMVYLTVSPVPL